VLRTRTPLVSIVLLLPVTVQLACIKPAASVHPEPGSNSPLYIISLLFFLSVLSFCYLPFFHQKIAGYLLLISIRSKNFPVCFGIAKILLFLFIPSFF
jgi:hypothetical protein